MHLLLASFSTGTDSPVKEDSSLFRSTDEISLISAGTIFPSSRITISPGTSSSLLILTIFPSLFT